MKFHQLRDINTEDVLVLRNAYSENLIINGNMQISQRGTSFVSPVTGAYTLDRWAVGTNAGTATITKAASTPHGTTQPVILWTNTSTGGSTLTGFDGIVQPIFARLLDNLHFGVADALEVTVSFQVRSSITGTYCVSILNNWLGAATRSYVTEYVIPVANTWTYVTMTIPGDVAGTWTAGNGLGMVLAFTLDTGASVQTTAGSWQSGEFYSTGNQVNFQSNSGATFFLTEVKMERGNLATRFFNEEYSKTAAACAFYFQKVSMLAHTSSWPTSANACVFPNMRTGTPTVTLSSLSAGSGAAYTVLNTGAFAPLLYQTANNSTAAFATVDLSAEL